MWHEYNWWVGEFSEGQRERESDEQREEGRDGRWKIRKGRRDGERVGRRV